MKNFTMLVAWLLLLLPFVVSLSVDGNYNDEFPSYNDSMVGLANSHLTSTLDPGNSHLHIRTDAADGLRGTNKVPWPKKKQNVNEQEGEYNTLRFCFVNEEPRKQLLCAVSGALTLWVNALGGRAGEASHHSLAVKEVDASLIDSHGNFNPLDPQPNYCFDKYDIPTRTPGKWNSNVPGGVLAIEYNYQMRSLSSVGYIPDSVDNNPWRHVMMLGVGASGRAEAHVVAHEFGHAFGMLHEHQRTDRDNYLQYNPTLVNGFVTAMTAAMNDIKPRPENQWVKDQLCDNWAFAKKYNFAGTAFTKGGREPGKPIDDKIGFDYDNIMLYPSNYGTSPNNNLCNTNLDFCPMVKISKDGSGNVVKARIEEKLKPSAKDAAFVKKYYPWPAV